jgi:hypothetical protein
VKESSPPLQVDIKAIARWWLPQVITNWSSREIIDFQVHLDKASQIDIGNIIVMNPLNPDRIIFEMDVPQLPSKEVVTSFDIEQT